MQRGIDAAVETVKDSLVASAKKVKDSDEIAQVSTISANGVKEIGNEAYNAKIIESYYFIKENKGIETELDEVERSAIDRDTTHILLLT